VQAEQEARGYTQDGIDRRGISFQLKGHQ
jgi:hypothetical protein